MMSGETLWMIDGMAIVQMIKDPVVKTFGELAEFMFDLILTLYQNRMVQRIDVLFDRYDVPTSIKMVERTRRNPTMGHRVQIINENTPLPKKWDKYLSNPQNKMDQTSFLSESWISMACSRLHVGQIFITSGGYHEVRQCQMVKYNPDTGSMAATDVIDLQSNHEEADTRLVLHAVHAAKTYDRHRCCSACNPLQYQNRFRAVVQNRYKE